MVAKREERANTYQVLLEALKPVRPASQVRYSTKESLYRYNLRHLDEILLALPAADLSPGLQRYKVRHLQEEFELGPVPKLRVPGLRAKPFSYQKVGIATIVERLEDGGGYMLNDEMGLGKSLQALASVMLIKQKKGIDRVLVVCPNSAKWVWEQQAERFTNLTTSVVDGTALQREQAIRKGADLTIVNFESAWRHASILKQQWDMIIVDEFHRIKNPKAKQTKAIISIRADRRLLMSGTPLLNSAEELWAPMYYVFPDFAEKFPSAWVFDKYFCIKSKGRWKKVIGYKNLGQLRDFLAANSLRRRKDQVLKDLPEVLHSTLLLELLPEQRKLYEQIRDEFLLALDNGEVRTISQVIAWVTRLKQACFSPELYQGSNKSSKLNELKEVVRSLTDSGEKCLIFSQWSKATRIIQRELAEYDPAYVDGSVKGRKRVAQQDKFNNDPNCKVYIGTIGANREAITLGAATYVIFTDKAWTPLDNEQAAARSAAGGLRGMGRQGQKINIITLFAKDTFEERIEQLLGAKKALFNTIVEADGGAAVDRVTVENIRELL